EAFSITSFQAAEVPGPTFRPDPYQLRDWNSLNALKKKIALSNGVFGEGAVFFRFKKDDLQSLRSEQRQNEEAGDRSLNVTGGGRASLNWKNESWDGLVALGINYSKYDFEGEIQKVRQFAVERIEVPASLTADFKMGSLWKLKPACLVTLSDSGAEASPRVGFEVRPHSDLRIVGFGGSFFRRPSISEVYGNERGIGSNPDLRTETAFKGELGLVWFLSRSHFSLVFFGARAKDLISLTQIGPDLQRAENIGQASWLGQEVLLNLQSSWGGYLRPSFLSLWTRNESDVAAERGKSLPFRFPTTFRLETGLNQNNWNMGYRASFYSSSFLDRVNQERLAPYQLHDVFVRLKVRELGSFELNIQNLFNLALAKTSNAGVDSNQFISGVNGYPTAGRRIGFTWVYDL
ncbi:TonB-dependent receptor, partial [bacterium]|nr:TonB-dependent receptor [bacterium]